MHTFTYSYIHSQHSSQYSTDTNLCDKYTWKEFVYITDWWRTICSLRFTCVCVCVCVSCSLSSASTLRVYLCLCEACARVCVYCVIVHIANEPVRKFTPIQNCGATTAAAFSTTSYHFDQTQHIHFQIVWFDELSCAHFRFCCCVPFFLIRSHAVFFVSASLLPRRITV